MILRVLHLFTHACFDMCENMFYHNFVVGRDYYNLLQKIREYCLFISRSVLASHHLPPGKRWEKL